MPDHRAPRSGKAPPAVRPDLTDLETGYLLGLLAGEGHFGGDGRQPQVTLRMHTRHEDLFRWLADRLPGSALYGPYTHGGRSYFQWMSRGAHLRTMLAPLVAAHLRLLDAHVAGRFTAMCEAYGITMTPPPAVAPSAPSPDGPLPALRSTGSG